MQDFFSMMAHKGAKAATYSGATGASTQLVATHALSTVVYWPRYVCGKSSGDGSIRITHGTGLATAAMLIQSDGQYFELVNLSDPDPAQTNDPLTLYTDNGTGTQWIQVVYQVIRVSGLTE